MGASIHNSIGDIGDKGFHRLIIRVGWGSTQNQFLNLYGTDKLRISLLRILLYYYLRLYYIIIFFFTFFNTIIELINFNNKETKKKKKNNVLHNLGCRQTCFINKQYKKVQNKGLKYHYKRINRYPRSKWMLDTKYSNCLANYLL